MRIPKAVRDVKDYLMVRKKFWLAPLLLVLLLVAILLVFVESSAISPFIYILF